MLVQVRNAEEDWTMGEQQAHSQIPPLSRGGTWEWGWVSISTENNKLFWTRLWLMIHKISLLLHYRFSFNKFCQSIQFVTYVMQPATLTPIINSK